MHALLGVVVLREHARYQSVVAIDYRAVARQSGIYSIVIAALDSLLERGSRKYNLESQVYRLTFYSAMQLGA